MTEVIAFVNGHLGPMGWSFVQAGLVCVAFVVFTWLVPYISDLQDRLFRRDDTKLNETVEQAIAAGLATAAEGVRAAEAALSLKKNVGMGERPSAGTGAS
jgi:hypothetical protein